jgi:hypothetical protein
VSLLEQWHEVGAALNKMLDQHTEQIGDRKQADVDHNTQLGQLTLEVHGYRRELRHHIDETKEETAQFRETVLQYLADIKLALSTNGTGGGDG